MASSWDAAPQSGSSWGAAPGVVSCSDWDVEPMAELQAWRRADGMRWTTRHSLRTPLDRDSMTRGKDCLMPRHCQSGDHTMVSSPSTARSLQPWTLSGPAWIFYGDSPAALPRSLRSKRPARASIRRIPSGVWESGDRHHHWLHYMATGLFTGEPRTRPANQSTHISLEFSCPGRLTPR